MRLSDGNGHDCDVTAICTLSCLFDLKKREIKTRLFHATTFYLLQQQLFVCSDVISRYLSIRETPAFNLQQGWQPLTEEVLKFGKDWDFLQWCWCWCLLFPSLPLFLCLFTNFHSYIHCEINLMSFWKSAKCSQWICPIFFSTMHARRFIQGNTVVLVKYEVQYDLKHETGHLTKTTMLP